MPTLHLPRFVVAFFAASLLASMVCAQTRPGSGATGATTTTPTAVPTRPTTTAPTNIPSPDISRPIYISGRVVLDQGNVVTEPVAIQRVCGGTVHRETYSDTHGNFSVLIGENITFQDASESNTMLGNRNSTLSTRNLWNCEIRAELPGYSSSAITLAGRDFNGSPDIGTIVLSKIGGIAGNSISVVSLKAPDNARHEYEKGLENYQKKKFAEAEKHLAKAVQIYPQYASAWELRGKEQQQQKLEDDARKSYETAIAADDKFVSPYIHLAVLDAADQHWTEVERLSSKAIQLDPKSYPDAYFLNGAAHYNLKHYQEAERSAVKAVELDKDHRFPRVELLLGSILQVKGDQDAAAQHLRTYLQLEPNSPEAARVQTILAKIDQQKASVAPPPKPQP